MLKAREIFDSRGNPTVEATERFVPQKAGQSGLKHVKTYVFLFLFLCCFIFLLWFLFFVLFFVLFCVFVLFVFLLWSYQGTTIKKKRSSTPQKKASASRL